MPLYAQLKEIPLDLQVDITLPEKADPLVKKLNPSDPPNADPEKTLFAPLKTISYDGVWVVKQTASACNEKLNDFKIRISGKEIDTFIGLDVEGTIKDAGKFEMDAATAYWSIKFTGKLENKMGRGVWIRKYTGKKNCSGAIQLVRVNS
ncbi:MAG: hypothetical protein AAF228_01260 [Pseudomonadota bacterium]